jgi:oligopeptidase A
MAITTSPIEINNPLLIGHGLPPFDRIQPEHIVPAMEQRLVESGDRLTSLEQTVKPTWEGLVEPLRQLVEQLTWSWGIVGHLMGVKNSPELREAYETAQPKIVEFFNRLGQSKPLYEAFKAIREGEDWQRLDNSQQRIVESAIRDAELSGVGLAGAQRDRFNAIQMELATLSTQFSNHVLDATKAYGLTLKTSEDIAGLPPSLLAFAAQSAREAGENDATPENGPWRITLDFPSFGPFMQHSQRRDLREQVYRAYISRASAGDYDNRDLIAQILKLRQEESRLLGYGTFAEVSLASKMAPSVTAVEDLLADLRQPSYAAAKADLEALKAFAAAKNALEGSDMKHWDTSFWSERLREEKYDLNDELLRPYFPLPQVLNGLFGLVNRIFGVTVTPANGKAPVWHEDVQYFQIASEQGEAIAHFYLDPYSRPAEKRGGAWMDDCIGRAKIAGIVRTPVAYLVCNQTPPVGGKPSLMTFREVETLFHEFGHGLHHMLTRVDQAGAAGINNVEWDAVELPSQFMENWCYDRATLFGMAKHYETGESLPEEYYQRLLAARTFMSGSATLRQVYFATLDLELHHRYQPGGSETIAQVRDRIAKDNTILPPLPEDAFLCSFGHIFAGGYAAGYYSYKWAEVLSADAFAAFEEADLSNESAIVETGKRFRETVLALGGSKHPMEIFKEFRGREPSTEALLRHSGLVAA